MEIMMRKTLIYISALALAGVSSMAVAQDAGTMTAAQVGVSPITGTPSQTYVLQAADSDMYEIQSSKLALSKARSQQTKDFAREMIADHTMTTKSLMAALPKTEPKLMKPGKAMSAPNMAKIAALRSASRDQFDALYMQQQADAHRTAWALHKGYATDGQDPALRQVAMTAVPIIEKHLSHAKGGAMGGMTGM
jgi:putative membrane protein